MEKRELQNKNELALELKHNRHNCAQAVLCAYSEEIGIPAETLKKLTAAFGGGMGGMEGNCGALCGAEMVLGMLKSEGKPLSKEASALFTEFKNRCGAAICREIKGIGTGKVLCSCDDCVANAVAILEEML